MHDFARKLFRLRRLVRHGTQIKRNAKVVEFVAETFWGKFFYAGKRKASIRLYEQKGTINYEFLIASDHASFESFSWI